MRGFLLIVGLASFAVTSPALGGTPRADRLAMGARTSPSSPTTRSVQTPTRERGAYANFRAAPTLVKPHRDERAATVLTYMATDDGAHPFGHQSHSSKRMVDMMEEHTPSGIHSVVFRDGDGHADSRLFDMSMPKHADAASRPRGIASASRIAPNVDEVQSNNPRVLQQVVKVAFDRYPGKRRFLQVYTHGNGVYGIGKDDHQVGPDGQPVAEPLRIMSVASFAESLRTGLHGRQIDAIYFRSCLMANIEALYELRGTVKYVVASEHVSHSTTTSNLTMTNLFQTLAATDTSTADIVKQVAIAGRAKRPVAPGATDAGDGGYRSLIAADLEKAVPLKKAINRLVAQLGAAPPSERGAIVAAYDAAPRVYGGPIERGPEMGDLWGLTRELQKRVKDPNVLAAVAEVRAAQRDFTLHARAWDARKAGRTDFRGVRDEDKEAEIAGGLSILMPEREFITQSIQATGYASTRFAKDTAWMSFLQSVAK